MLSEYWGRLLLSGYIGADLLSLSHASGHEFYNYRNDQNEPQCTDPGWVTDVSIS